MARTRRVKAERDLNYHLVSRIAVREFKLRDLEAEMILARWRRRMEDVSEFVKTLKETFDIWYKRHHAYTGSIWEGRFKSTCVQDGRYLRRCIAYVECNPIRAGLASRRGEYVWSSSPAEGEGAEADAGERRFVSRRRAQVANGRLLGELAFVEAGIGEFSDRFHNCGVCPHGVVGSDGYSSHGHRLASIDAAGEAA